MSSELSTGREKPAAQASQRLAWTYIHTVITLFFIGWTFVYADRTAMFPLLPTIGRDLGLNESQTGLIVSIYFATYVVMQLPGGMLGERFGHARVLAVCYGLGGLGMLAIGTLAFDYASLLVFVAVFALGAGAYYTNAYGLSMAVIPAEQRGRASGIINGGMAAGMIVGLVSAGPLLSATGEWRVPFLILGVPTVIVAVVFALLLRPTPAVEHGASETERVTLAGLLKDRDLLLLTVGTFCTLIGWWVVITWAPGFFQTERGMDPSLSGILTAVIAITALPASWFSGRLSDRLGRKRMSLVMLPAAGVLIAAMAVLTSVPALVVVMIAYGALGKLAWDPVSLAWYADRASELRPGAISSALGLFSTVGMVSSIVAPVAGGWLKELTGSFGAAFFLSAALSIVGGVVLLFPAETIRRERLTGR